MELAQNLYTNGKERHFPQIVNNHIGRNWHKSSHLSKIIGVCLHYEVIWLLIDQKL
jgi:hypothetical protein